MARERERGARARAPGGGPRARWLAWCPPRENPQFPPAQTELTQMPSSSRALTGQSQTARDLGSARPKKKKPVWKYLLLVPAAWALFIPAAKRTVIMGQN